MKASALPKGPGGAEIPPQEQKAARSIPCGHRPRATSLLQAAVEELGDVLPSLVTSCPPLPSGPIQPHQFLQLFCH